jgi:hypothetical protein
LAERPLKKGIEGEREGDFTDNFNVKHWQKFQPLLYPAEICWISWQKKVTCFDYCWSVIEENTQLSILALMT